MSNMKLAIYPVTYDLKPCMCVYQRSTEGTSYVGAQIIFPLNPETIQELRDAADKCDSFLAKFQRETEIRERIEAEMRKTA